MNVKYIQRVAIILFVLCMIGCQRIKTETAGGGTAKNQPVYDEKLQKPNPNMAGNNQ